MAVKWWGVARHSRLRDLKTSRAVDTSLLNRLDGNSWGILREKGRVEFFLPCNFVNTDICTTSRLRARRQQRGNGASS